MSAGAKIGLWILAALVLAFVLRQLWPERIPGPVRVEVRKVPDSAAYRMAALELEGVKGQLRLERERSDRQTRRSADWQERASMYKALYESMQSDTGTLDVVGRLDTLYQGPPDSAGRTYMDTVNAVHRLAADTWDLHIGYQPRMVDFVRVDSTIYQEVPVPTDPWYLWPLTAAAAIAGFLIAK